MNNLFAILISFFLFTELSLATSPVDDASKLAEIMRTKRTFPIPVNFTTEKPITVLISCIDCRLRDETETLMECLNLKNKYFEIALPGGSLAISGSDSHLFFEKEEERTEYTHLSEVALSTIKFIKKHKETVTSVILLDHSNCAAYGNFKGKFPEELASKTTRESLLISGSGQEIGVHKTQFNIARDIIDAFTPIKKEKIYRLFYQFKLDEVDKPFDAIVVNIDYDERSSSTDKTKLLNQNSIKSKL